MTSVKMIASETPTTLGCVYLNILTTVFADVHASSSSFVWAAVL